MATVTGGIIIALAVFCAPLIKTIGELYRGNAGGRLPSSAPVGTALPPDFFKHLVWGLPLLEERKREGAKKWRAGANKNDSREGRKNRVERPRGRWNESRVRSPQRLLFCFIERRGRQKTRGSSPDKRKKESRRKEEKYIE